MHSPIWLGFCNDKMNANLFFQLPNLGLKNIFIYLGVSSYVEFKINEEEE